MTHEPASEQRCSRRNFLKTSGALLAGGATMFHAPFIHTASQQPLRVMGTEATVREAIRKKAQEDLGFPIVFEQGGSAWVQQRASARPHAFDIYEQWSNSMNILWRANAIQPIEIKRLKYWNEVNNLTKTGRLTPDARIGLGDAPHKLLYVQANGELGARESDKISFLPYVHNTDSFGYDTRIIPKSAAYVGESWAWLLDERWRGKVAVVSEPTIGIFDMAMAVEAKGLMTFADMGDMTEAEVDQLFNILIPMKRKGHFCGFWNSIPESCEFMESGLAVIASMFSPAISDLNEQGIPAVYAAPKEGYRAWHGVMCLSSLTTGRVRDMAYEFMNWWLDGWAGAYIARQGYYISIPERTRPHLTRAEWNYWYEGMPAAEDLYGSNGKRCVRKGTIRNGGSYWQRFSRIAVWNTVMDTYEYILPRWHEFLLA
ncbi:MAG: extracellular solute-binding protein [Magnetococcales bacterium]|nr:extracellular solute-binding protein [Magnetococcales bacterium]MBF0629897.1 extracellular solute-binding protein [Magnetococcales bacterium]